MKKKRKFKNGIAVYDPTKVVSAESTGGAGYAFERQMQSLFAVLMVCDGELAFAPDNKISKLQFQVRNKGYCVDDWRAELVDNAERPSQVLFQAKRELSFTDSCIPFTDTIQAAWIDYNDVKFNKGTDKIVIVTGPIRKTDSGTLDWLIEHARSVPVEGFSDELSNGAGISKGKRRVYELICKIVRIQNSNAREAEIIEFLRHLYVFCPDTVYGNGSVASFAISLLKERFQVAQAQQVLNSLETIVGNINAIGGETTKKDLVSRSRLSDHRKVIVEESAKLSPIPTKAYELILEAGDKVALRKDYHALLSLVGMWSEDSSQDRSIIGEILGVSPEKLEELLQTLTQAKSELLKVEYGIASIKHRRELWRDTASYVSKEEIHRYVRTAVRLLAIEDKSFNFKPDQRYLLSEQDHGFEGSKLLREGLAQGMALFASEAESAKQLTFDEKIGIPIKFIREIFFKRDWRIWASLDDLLPYFAEIDPSEYLRQVGTFVRKEGDLARLFGQEYRGLFGRTYITGLVNSLCVLAWFPECLAKSLQILGQMAKRDSGGQWSPRPIDTFRTVLHPLAPHTWAMPDDRAAVFSGLVKKLNKDIAWKAVSSLLPTGFFSTFQDDRRPIYRLMAEGPGPSKSEDDEAISREFEHYCCLAVDLIGRNPERVRELASNALDYWSDVAFKRFAKHIEKIAHNVKAEAKYEIWRSIQGKLDLLRLEDDRKKSVKWDHWRLKTYISLERLYEPLDVRFKARPLFGWSLANRNENDTFDLKVQYVQKIYKSYGVKGVIDFAANVDSAGEVGTILGRIGNESIDSEICPELIGLGVNGSPYSVCSYISERFASAGWGWVDKVITPTWTKEQIAGLLVNLPFCKDVWGRLNTYLDNDESLYWRNILYPHVSDISDLSDAIDGLLSVKRGFKALELVSHHVILNHGVDAKLCLKVLRAFMDGNVEDEDSSSAYHNLSYAIKKIQDDSQISIPDKSAVEWFFIDLADWHCSGHGFRPLALESRLATDPKFFVEALCIAYLPEKKAAEIKRELEKKPLPESEQQRNVNVYKMLHCWRRVPGALSDNTFDEKVFKLWVKDAFALAKKEDRQRMAKAMLANVLIYAPKDKDGFWIPRVAARLMEKRGNETMLSHYRNAWFNSRGVHSVDKTGAEDKKLADKYTAMAVSAEQEGFPNLGREMRSLSQSIRDDFARMQEDDKVRDSYFAAQRELRA